MSQATQHIFKDRIHTIRGLRCIKSAKWDGFQNGRGSQWNARSCILTRLLLICWGTGYSKDKLLQSERGLGDGHATWHHHLLLEDPRERSQGLHASVGALGRAHTERRSMGMSPTRHCKPHHGGRRWECPSQWGCPAMSLGMAACLGFYAHMETWMKQWVMHRWRG